MLPKTYQIGKGTIKNAIFDKAWEEFPEESTSSSFLRMAYVWGYYNALKDLKKGKKNGKARRK